MTKSSALLVLLALAGPLGGRRALSAQNTATATATATAKCPKRPPASMPLFFKLRKPVKANGEAARAILRERFPCLVLLCTRKSEMFAYLSKRDEAKLLGKHVVYTLSKGSGNSANTDATFVSIRPESFVPDFLKDYVARLRFEDDPKFDYTGPDARRCE